MDWWGSTDFARDKYINKIKEMNCTGWVLNDRYRRQEWGKERAKRSKV
jgi:hypothetical protein